MKTQPIIPFLFPRQKGRITRRVNTLRKDIKTKYSPHLKTPGLPFTCLFIMTCAIRQWTLSGHLGRTRPKGSFALREGSRTRRYLGRRGWAWACSGLWPVRGRRRGLCSLLRSLLVGP